MDETHEERTRERTRNRRRRHGGITMTDHEPRHGRGRGGRRHRARRGAVGRAVLTLLAERPMHGYELITELEERSDGRWRPSPGAIYPALGRLEDHGLITSSEVDGKRRFALTDAGRQRLAELEEEHGDEPAPWADAASGARGDLRRQLAELAGQVRQIARFGSSAQRDRAVAVLADTTRELYAVLATVDEPVGEPADGADDPDT